MHGFRELRIFTTTVGKFQSCLMNIQGKGSHAERLQFQRENGRRTDFSRGPQQIQRCCVWLANDFPGRVLEGLVGGLAEAVSSRR